MSEKRCKQIFVPILRAIEREDKTFQKTEGSRPYSMAMTLRPEYWPQGGVNMNRLGIRPLLLPFYNFLKLLSNVKGASLKDPETLSLTTEILWNELNKMKEKGERFILEEWVKDSTWAQTSAEQALMKPALRYLLVGEIILSLLAEDLDRFQTWFKRYVLELGEEAIELRKPKGKRIRVTIDFDPLVEALRGIDLTAIRLKRCAVCKEVFSVARIRQKYCSAKCRNKAQTPRTEYQRTYRIISRVYTPQVEEGALSDRSFKDLWKKLWSQVSGQKKSPDEIRKLAKDILSEIVK